MPTFTDIATLIPTLGGRLAAGDRAEDALAVLQRMTDADVVEVLAETAALERQVEQIQVAASGVIAARSRRESGHSGLAASRGHRSAAALVQDVTGSTKVDADRKVRVGEALLVVEAGAASVSTGADSAATSSNLDRRRLQPWFQPLRDALRDGRLTSAQFDAIRRGLGEPPEIARAASESDDDFHVAWTRAADHLVAEAAQRNVEELCQQARSIRDVLDPEGARVRHLERFERRSFRTYRSQDGQKRASLVLDDEGDLFLETILAAALRPRRGGPRFVDAAERQQAATLADDPRTNDQLAYDLILDVLRAGALADAESVFGTRQAGVRLVQVTGADAAEASVVYSEDRVVTVPAAVAERHACDAGFVPVTVDSRGNPLSVGREQRLFTSRQRIALAIRDGGCRWRGCDRPASYCESHHIDEWSRDQGRTDIDRGILLCRYHHMTLHHGGWRITRHGTEDFVLQDATGETQAMRPRAVLKYAFGGFELPPRRFQPGRFARPGRSATPLSGMSDSGPTARRPRNPGHRRSREASNT